MILSIELNNNIFRTENWCNIVLTKNNRTTGLQYNIHILHIYGSYFDTQKLFKINFIPKVWYEENDAYIFHSNLKLIGGYNNSNISDNIIESVVNNLKKYLTEEDFNKSIFKQLALTGLIYYSQSSINENNIKEINVL